MNMPLLQTERTAINYITKADAPFMFELVNTPGWLRYIGDRNIRCIEDAEKYIEKSYYASYERYGFSYLLVSSKVDNNPIGICGFLKKDYLEFPDFGFAFMPEHHQKGYGYESGNTVLKYGIENLNLGTVDAITMLDNHPSIKLLTKLGFVAKGTITVPETNEELNLFRLQSY